MAQLSQMHQSMLVNSQNSSTVEFARILWWSLFLLDRHQCYIFQRPYMILEQHCHTPLPEAVHYFADQGGGLSDTLIDNSFLLIQIQWARLVGNAWDTCSSNQASVRDLLGLEKAFYVLESELPLPFRIHDTPVTARRGVTYFQGLVFSLRTYHIRARILLKLQMRCLRRLPQDCELRKFRDSVGGICVGL
ncbi:hypothetical protein P691DRAFT_258184 [Macrolepiota fuliginosa MF-IS2]|uniref:Xylanolytic transcriptional activator regulatory domain-containing protein n=1 Tax=Macrolepiota fuliginosa MF-IS2 TaxID=1400762 RepID=A0A9P5XIT4_9AGAR|nr:hypothetical protein P691DRAFT_258184 [Macrolepiota fuliginosa MF-IS2]